MMFLYDYKIKSKQLKLKLMVIYQFFRSATKATTLRHVVRD